MSHPLAVLQKRKLIWYSWEKNKRGPIMAEQQSFKWRHFEAEIILVCVRWYLRCALSYRDLRNDAGTRVARRSHDDLPLGAALRP